MKIRKQFPTNIYSNTVSKSTMKTPENGVKHVQK